MIVASFYEYAIEKELEALRCMKSCEYVLEQPYFEELDVNTAP